MELLVQSSGTDAVNKHALFFLSNMEALEEKISLFDSSNEKCEQIKVKTLKFFEGISGFRPSSAKKVNGCFKCCYETAKELNLIEQKQLIKVKKDIKKLEMDFSYLLNPSQLPKAYKESLKEISRRRHFNKLLKAKLAALNKIGDLENHKRKKFLGQYGRVLPQHFIP